MIRVLIVDDHPLAVAGLRMLLGAAAGIEIAGATDSAAGALSTYASLRPDVVICDYYLPVRNGLYLVEQLLRSDPACKILVVSSVETAEIPAQLLRAGALGYVVKAADASVLIRAVRKVAKGERYVDESLAGAALFEPSELDKISGRLLQVLTLLAEGRTNAEIAMELEIGEVTVRRHKSRLLAKLGIDRETALIAMARAAGFGRNPC
ncbi:response regulator transcription factor [Lysobacter firmicutimachus]|uniref:Response regulator transcription factor n=1 Tax=Lysobacter firmicutimachus TaxID=1792846 RepID=A0AAU8MUU5_9GAMM|nr:response regulator transcription factor [Lysobacter antibioticus]